MSGYAMYTNINLKAVRICLHGNSRRQITKISEIGSQRTMCAVFKSYVENNKRYVNVIFTYEN